MTANVRKQKQGAGLNKVRPFFFPTYQNLTAGVDNWGNREKGQHMEAVGHKKGFKLLRSSSEAIAHNPRKARL
jgi:hypothetical protein